MGALHRGNYAPGELLGKPIIGIVNFAEKKMGPEVSQVLVLGAPNEKGETIYLMPQTDVLPGAKEGASNRGVALHQDLGRRGMRTIGQIPGDRGSYDPMVALYEARGI